MGRGEGLCKGREGKCVRGECVEGETSKGREKQVKEARKNKTEIYRRQADDFFLHCFPANSYWCVCLFLFVL